LQSNSTQEIEMNRSAHILQAALWIAVSAAIATAALSSPAYAEYRCATLEQLSNVEKQACELARQDTPDALRRYIHRMNTINAGLYISDYVGKADAERWELARQKPRLEQLGSATSNDSANGTENAK
jgi:hypothetical protein